MTLLSISINNKDVSLMTAVEQEKMGVSKDVVEKTKNEICSQLFTERSPFSFQVKNPEALKTRVIEAKKSLENSQNALAKIYDTQENEINDLQKVYNDLERGITELNNQIKAQPKMGSPKHVMLVEDCNRR